MNADGLGEFSGGVNVKGSNLNVIDAAKAVISNEYSGNDVYGLLAAPGLSGNSSLCSAIRISRGPDNGFTRTDYRGINILDFKTNAAGQTRYGVYSALTKGADGENYNFYAEGDSAELF